MSGKRSWLCKCGVSYQKQELCADCGYCGQCCECLTPQQMESIVVEAEHRGAVVVWGASEEGEQE